MARLKVVGVTLVVLAWLSVPAVWAQQASGIAGVVRDSSGGVLPGVTVEVRSPALIEGVRTVFTDGEGRYNVVDLRPGTYSVTFVLPGFSTFVRDGIALTSGFTATVNADMAVGGLDETITVTGEAPLVDTQNVRRQTVASRELLDTLPMATQHVSSLVTLTPGFSGLAEVGGQYQSQLGGSGTAAYHGKSGSQVRFDGMGVENSSANSSYQINALVVQEMVLQTSGISAEASADGAVVNIIPRDGGNTFATTLAGLYSNDSLEGSNLTDELRARGLNSENKTISLFDYGASVGGRIVRDKLWFFGAARSWGFSRQHAGVFWNKTQNVELTPPGAERAVVLWTPWVDRPIDRFSGRLEWYDSYLGRLAWQASARHRFNFTFDSQEACNCGSTSAANAQEVSSGYRFDPNVLFQSTWSAPITTRLLLEAGNSVAISQWNQYLPPGVDYRHVRIQDQGLGLSYGANLTFRGDPNHTDRYAQRFAVSYVTGSHAFKAGFNAEELVQDAYWRSNGSAWYRFRNGVPNLITQQTTPYLENNRTADYGFFVQDQWTMNRYTLSLGIRYDQVYGWIPEQRTPGETSGWVGAAKTNPWLPPRTLAPVSGAPSWKDISPRVGVAYDLFGDGRTAVKVSLGRYVAKTSTNITGAINPINTSVNSASRSWNDANRDYVPDCDLGNFGANGECGAINNVNFGQNNPNAVRWADDVLSGWGARDSNWDFSSEFQHQLLEGLSMTTGYYRNSGGYFSGSSNITGIVEDSKVRVMDNLAVTRADFDPYCITAPRDPRLPGGGGYQVCGLYDISPAKFGQVEQMVKRTSNFGDVKMRNDFFNVIFDGRLGRGIRIGGGIDTGRSVRDRCFVVDSPQALLHCRVVTPFSAQTQIKLNGSVPLPGDFIVSAAFQNLAGAPIQANYAATNAEIAPSLGRSLAGRRRTATVPLIAPNTLFEDRLTRLDLRVSKVVRVANYRLQLNLDAYNALNTSSVRAVNNTFGSRWLRPNAILDPRLIQFSARLTF